ncbi:HAMP domain-containing histidine kinase [Paenibacillus donghaensis]|uniref:HAMP domain-containing sensor histidine kinase n=1 Tax=Paenibacillus donghaensis TaxID=414771 RepID=UPI0018838792|nr:HAMP domain-containing sensor histidine kinase [Paenibacillus donghaensis]MBE9914810.1 HAMP domain-containing histidine kinase [Paenibacillus donghaensis]
MRAKSILWIMLVIFIVGVLFSIRVMEQNVDTKLDIVMANSILKTVESHWNRIEQGDYSDITQPFTVLDHNGKVRYQSADAVYTGLYDAIRDREAVMDVTVGGITVGKLIIHDHYEKQLQASKQKLVTIIIVTFILLSLLAVLYIVYLHYAIMKPFQKLKSFAQHVARGNLDIPLSMDKNNPFGAFTESFDMMREQLAAARQSEYEANRSKKELVASLSHDVKTPVASIKAVSELMLLRATDEKTIKQLNMIYSKAEQVNLLVTDMFHATLEELEELKVIAREESSQILTDIIANVNFDDQITCGPIPECIMIADMMRLQQVFDNILSNSYKYAGTAVTISASLIPGYLQLEIMDYGNGVSTDELPLLCNKFYRGNHTSGQNGAGLGLYISKYLMQSMQGDLECCNREDGFSVILRISLAR